MDGPTIAQLVAGVHKVMEKVKEGMAALGQAADALDEAIRVSSASLVGGSGLGEVVPPFQDARRRVLEDLQLCGQVTKLGAKIVIGFGGGPTTDSRVPPSPRAPVRTREPARQRYPVDPEWSTLARARLPVRRPGGQTHGEYVDQDGITHTVMSGTEAGVSAELNGFLTQQRLIPPRFVSGVDTSTHVELKVAWRMRTSGTRRLTLAINNTVDRGVYGCHRLLPWVLPAGYTLEVHDDQGKHVYEGRGGGR